MMALLACVVVLLTQVLPVIRVQLERKREKDETVEEEEREERV